MWPKFHSLSEILVIIECLIAKTEKAVAEVVDDIDSAFLSSIVTFTDHTDCAIAIEVALKTKWTPGRKR